MKVQGSGVAVGEAVQIHSPWRCQHLVVSICPETPLDLGSSLGVLGCSTQAIRQKRLGSYGFMLWSYTGLGSNPGSPLTSSMTLGKFLTFSELHFSQRKNEVNKPSRLEGWGGHV